MCQQFSVSQHSTIDKCATTSMSCSSHSPLIQSIDTAVSKQQTKKPTTETKYTKTSNNYNNRTITRLFLFLFFLLVHWVMFSAPNNTSQHSMLEPLECFSINSIYYQSTPTNLIDFDGYHHQQNCHHFVRMKAKIQNNIF